jgi:hypothetical protein
VSSQTKKLLITTALLIFAATRAAFVCAQEPAAVIRARPFEPAEELVYVAEFSRALLKKIDVADFRFTASKEEALHKTSGAVSNPRSGETAYLLKFTGEVSSRGFFIKLFNLHFRERVESIVEPTSFTVQKTKRIDEQGKRARASEAVFDHANGEVRWSERDPNNSARAPRTASSSFTGQIQDVLSAIYYLRTQPLEIGKTLEVTVSDSGRVYQVQVRVMEKRRLKTILGRIEALLIEPELFGPNRMVEGNGRFSIWLTNDIRRIPVSARLKTDYGTFDITLRKVVQKPNLREYLSNTNGH